MTTQQQDRTNRNIRDLSRDEISLSGLTNRLSLVEGRLHTLDNSIHGTKENDFSDGLKPQVRRLIAANERTARWVNRWGFALLGSFVGFGLLNGSAAHTLGKLVAALSAVFQ